MSSTVSALKVEFSPSWVLLAVSLAMLLVGLVGLSREHVLWSLGGVALLLVSFKAGGVRLPEAGG